MSPYAFGMFAAFIHLKDTKNIIYKTSSVAMEWIAFIFLIASGFIGFNPETTTWMYHVSHYFWICFGRAIYGLTLAYLIVLILSPKTEENLEWYRPIRYMRWFLTLPFWVPFASLSYSMYVVSVDMIESVPKMAFFTIDEIKS